MADADTSPERIPITCTLDCGSRCELVACVQDGRLLRIDTPTGRPDTVERPRLIPCARGRGHRRLNAVSERLTHPLRCVGPKGLGQFEVVSWEEALDEVAQKLTEVREQYGTEAVLAGFGAGSTTGRGFSGATAGQRFFSYWGPVTGLVGGMSNHCANVAAAWMLGGRIPASDRATLLHSRLILIWGMNPAENHMGPNTEHFIAEARDLGARVILIDPRYSDSAVLADEWIPIVPSTDAALVAAMAYVMETEDLVDQDFMASHTIGYPIYRRYLLGQDGGVVKTPEWAERITQVPAKTTRRLAREYATVKPAALLPGWGPQRTLYGEQPARAFITLACMSGNVGLLGGALASTGGRKNIVPVGELPFGPFVTSARGLPKPAFASAILEDRLDPPIKMAYIVASNIINRTPNTLANAAALKQIDFVVVNEQFLTPTARCADLVLPICTDLERTDLVTSDGHDSHLFYSPQILAPPGEARTDYWVFAQLAERLGFGQEYTGGRNQEEWVELLMKGEGLDERALRDEGIMRIDGKPRVALAEFREDPRRHPLNTPSGLIEIASPQAEAYGLPVIPAYVAEDIGETEAYPLRLLTPHHKFRSNSCVRANPWLQRLEPHVAWMNPGDARARGIAHGDSVVVRSRFGAVVMPAKVTERIMPGVVCVYQGTWYQPGADGLDVGGCANVLTGSRLTPTGGPATHSERVEMRRVG